MEYILFLAENTGLVSKDKCSSVAEELARIENFEEFIGSISKS